MIKQKNKVILFIICAIVVVAIAVTAIVLIVNANKTFEVNVLCFSNWELIEEHDYYLEYEGTLVSDQKRPFLALVGYSDFEVGDLPYLVFMKDGKGTIKISASDEDDLIYSDSILGYVPVTEIDSSALSFSLENETFTELSWGGIRDICNINFKLINFKLNENRNGFIYLEIVNESDKEPYSLKRLVPIVNGVGSLEYDGTIADGSKEMKLSVNPICFVKTQEFNDGDIVVEKELEIEKDEYSFGTFFNGNAKYTMPTIDSGFVCYSKTLISGGYSNMRGVKEYSWDTIFKHELEVYVSSYTVDVEGYETPKYDLEMIGYVPFIKVQIRKG